MARHRKSQRMGMDDDLAQRLLRGVRRLDCRANLTETPQLNRGNQLTWAKSLLEVRVHS